MMKRTMLAAVVSVCLVPAALGQELSAVQKEVWASVSQLQKYFAAGDIENVSKLVHPDFVFWNSANSYPGDKQTANKIDMTWVELGGKWQGTTISPLTVQVYGEFAVVNAYVRGFQQQPGEKPLFVAVRWHSDWKKEDGKWLQVANFVYPEQ